MMMVTIKGEISLEQKEMAMEMESVLQEENGEMIVGLEASSSGGGGSGAGWGGRGDRRDGGGPPHRSYPRVESDMMTEVCHASKKMREW